jgi:voltage-gated potassium channel
LNRPGEKTAQGVRHLPPPRGGRETLRYKAHVQLDPKAWAKHGLSPVNWAVSILIVVSSAIAVLDTEPTIRAAVGDAFFYAEYVISCVFLVEYIARVWSAGERARYRGFMGRIRYMLTPAALIDLIALLPLFVLMGAGEGFLLRIVRLVRILRLARLAKFSHAFRTLGRAIKERTYELILSVGIAFVMLLFSATGLYLVEGDKQPEALGSIPRALWWSVATLTTVGYGDVYPVTALGRLIGAITALSAVVLIALPSGIMAAAFSDAVQRAREERKARREAGLPEEPEETEEELEEREELRHKVQEAREKADASARDQGHAP